MAGFEVLTAEGWTPVRIEHRTTILADGAALQVATLPELARLLRLFGRPKDLARLAWITPPGV